MKQAKWLTGLLAGAMIFSFTACGNSSNGSTTAQSSTATAATTPTGTNTTASTTDSALNQDEILTQLTELAEQENAIFESHQELWNKVFMAMDKDVAGTTTDYCEFLLSTIGTIQDDLSDAEVETLKADVELLRPLEEQRAPLLAQYTPTEESLEQSITVSAFPSFTGKDLDGNDVDSSIFSQNAVTLVSLWFSTCKPCVEELSTLNQLNEDLKVKGGAVIGINTDTLDGNEDAIAEANRILSEKGATYQNIYFPTDSDAGNMLSQIFSFPTTLLVDRNGNIIGDPIVGGVTSDEVMDEVNSRIDEILAADQGA